MQYQTIQKIQGILQAVGEAQEGKGASPESIAQGEKNLGIQLHPLLKAFYEHFGEHPLFQDKKGFQFNLEKVESLIVESYDEEPPYITLFTGDPGYGLTQIIRVSEMEKAEPMTEYWSEEGLGNKSSLAECLEGISLHNLQLEYQQKATFDIKYFDTNVVTQKYNLIADEQYGNDKVWVTVYGANRGCAVNAKEAADLLDCLLALGLNKYRGDIQLNFDKESQPIDFQTLQKFVRSKVHLSYEWDMVSVQELQDLLTEHNGLVPLSKEVGFTLDSNYGTHKISEIPEKKAKSLEASSQEINEIIQQGLDSIDEKETVELKLKDVVHLYKVFGEMNRFFQEAEHYQNPQDLETFLGDQAKGLRAEIFKISHQVLPQYLPHSIEEKIDEEQPPFDAPFYPFYYHSKYEDSFHNGTQTVKDRESFVAFLAKLVEDYKKELSEQLAGEEVEAKEMECLKTEAFLEGLLETIEKMDEDYQRNLRLEILPSAPTWRNFAELLQRTKTLQLYPKFHKESREKQ